MRIWIFIYRSNRHLAIRPSHMGVLRNLASGFWYIFQEKRRWSQWLFPAIILSHPVTSLPASVIIHAHATPQGEDGIAITLCGRGGSAAAAQPVDGITAFLAAWAAGAAPQPQRSRWRGGPLPPRSPSAALRRTCTSNMDLYL